MEKKGKPEEKLRRFIRDAAEAFEQVQETSQGISRRYEILLGEKDLLEQIVNHLPALVMIVSTDDLLVRWANKKLEEVYGLQAAENTPLSLIDRIHEEDQHQLMRMIDYMHAHPGEPYKVMLRLRNKWNDLHYLNATVTAFERTRSGIIKRVLLTAVDITRLTETENELKNVLRELAAIRMESNEMHITSREMEVLRLIAREFSTKQIADELTISIPTVETHRRNLLRKLKVKNTAGLIRFTMENMLLD